MSTTTQTPSPLRAVVRCVCGLNQFDAELCRRCRKPLHPETPSQPAQARTPAEAIAAADAMSLVLRKSMLGIRRERPEEVTDLSRAIGRLVRSRRRLLISQKEFARAIGVSNPHLCLIEGGRTNPSLRMVTAIAEVLKMPVSEIFRQAEQLVPEIVADREATRPFRIGPKRVTAAEMQEVKYGS